MNVEPTHSNGDSRTLDKANRQKTKAYWVATLTRGILIFNGLNFLWAWLGLQYIMREGVVVPYGLIVLTNNVAHFLFLSAWFGPFSLLILRIFSRFHVGWIIISAFLVLCSSCAWLFTDEFQQLDTAQFNGRLYHLVFQIDYEGKTLYSLYECDTFGNLCRGKHIAYTGDFPCQLVVDDISRKMSVILYRNNDQVKILYELYAAEP